MSENGLRIAIIGGGIAGLATAFNLEQTARETGTPLQVTLFERSNQLGGNLRTIKQDGFVVEEGPNGFLDNEPATLRLVEKLKLGPELQRSEDASRHRFLMKSGVLHELPMSPPAFVKSGLLSPLAKVRVACEILLPGRKDLPLKDAVPDYDETVYDFGCRRLGRAFAETFLDPMVKGIFGGDARKLSLCAAFPRMIELEREHGSLFKALMRISKQRKKEGTGAAAPGPSGTLHSFAGGIRELPARLGSVLEADIRTGNPVERTELKGDQWWIHAGGDAHGPYAAVVDASPAYAAGRHLPGRKLRAQLGGIYYAPMAVISLAFDRETVEHDLNGFGMLIPTQENRRLLGVLWTSSIFSGRSPEGKVLMRCMAGGPSRPCMIKREDSELIRICLEELGELYGLRGRPERTWVIRWEKAIAQYEPGHLARLASIRKLVDRMPGLFLVGSAYRGVSINHCIAEAERTATAVFNFIRPGIRVFAGVKGR